MNKDPLDPENLPMLEGEDGTRQAVRVVARRTRNEASTLAESPTCPPGIGLARKLGIGAEARADREVRALDAQTRVKARQSYNEVLLDMHDAVHKRELERFRNDLALMYDAHIRANWAVQTAGTLASLEELYGQIDRSDERITAVRSKRVREKMEANNGIILELMSEKVMSLLPR